MERKIECVCKEYIKPTSPTPSHLRCLDFSPFDLAIPANTVTVSLYYPLPQEQESSSTLLVLKKSLSHLLSRFYPFAGRINDDYTSIICNDEGVPFLQAFAHGYCLDDIVGQPSSNMDLLSHLLPYEESLFSTSIPLLVQVTFFECGGMSIGIRASHKITDASTLNTLIRGWAAIAASSCDPKMTRNLEFVHVKKFLPQRAYDKVFSQGRPESSEHNMQNKDVNDNVCKIFFFNASCIAELKAKVVSNSVPVPTRVDALSALIWKCTINSSTKKKPYSVMIRPINLRQRHGFPLPSDCMGNAVSAITTVMKSSEMDLSDLVILLRNSLSEFLDEYENKEDHFLALTNAGIEMSNQLKRDGVEVYILNSYCGFKICNTNFGWGKPCWISQSPAKNYFLLMETRRSGGGIEAWVSLAKADMEIFEQELHQQLTGFTGFEVL